MTAKGSKLLVEHVSRSFPGVHGGAPLRALMPIDLSVATNDFITILGPSGCGKSTLLRIVAGLDHPSEGRVLLDGRAVAGPGPDRGMVFQSYTLFPWLTVAENIAFGLREKGMPQAERRDVVANYVELVGLKGRERDRVKTFSGGMKRRLNLAASLLHDPDLLLLDEPTVGVDPQSRNAIFENLELLKRRGKALVYTTHYMEEAERLADRLVVIDHGAVVGDDTVEGLKRLAGPSGDGPVTLETVFLAMTGRSLRD